MTIALTKGGERVFTLRSNKEKLAKNSFMKYWLQYSSNHLTLELPSFCDVIMFRILNIFLSEREALLSNDLSIEFYTKMLLSSEYFLCQ